MEEELLLKQPADRRLVDLPPGTVDLPLGVDDFETKKSEKELTSSKKSTRRSPTPKRKSPSNSRSRRSPSPPPRRNRYRYSPDRRGSRFDRRRSPPPRDRYRGRGGNRRGQSSSRSRSRSLSPGNRRGGRSRWSPKKKPNSPPPQQPHPQMPIMNNNPQMMLNAPPPPTGQFGVPMQAPPPPHMVAAYGGYAQTYQGFGQQPDAYAGNYNTGYATQNTWSGQDAYNQQAWMQAPVPNPNQQTQMSNTGNFSNTVNQTMTMPSTSADASAAHDAAVAQEAENQREELKKQRSSYITKNSLLKKELKMLRDQRKDLDSGAAPPSPTTKGFIDENEKLQNQIIKKIATIDNVIEMLTGVIGEEHVEQMNASSLNDDGAATKMGTGMKTAEISKNDPRLANIKAKQQQQQQHHQQQQQLQQHQKKGNTSTSSNSSNDGSHSSNSSSSSSSGSSSSSEDEKEMKKGDNKTGDNKQNDDDDDSSPERLKHKVMESMKSKQRTLSATALKEFPSLSEKVKIEKSVIEMNQPRFNYAFYDPEMHWCQKCNVFPKTAKDYLNHLHSKDHMEKENATETPWHSNIVDDNFPVYENVQTKRMPIRGITFFTPATAWFCKLCSVWMGDLHCASVHLKSRQHSNKYTAFLERNPNFEMNWLADRQRVLNEKNLEAAASQITAVSTTAAEERENRKQKKNDEKSNKKHKKNSEKKDKKKKKKRNKKRKKANQGSSSDSSDSDSTSSDDAEEKQIKKKKKLLKLMSPIKDLDNPNPAASIRLAMRKAENSQVVDDEQTPPPPTISMTIASNNNATKRPLGHWTVAQEGVGKVPDQESLKTESKNDDSIMQQWNSVQPVISDNEKKLLEQLKGKLKTTTTTKSTGSTARDTKDGKDSDKSDANKSRNTRMERNRRDRDASIDRIRGRRSRTRSPTRSRSRGRDWRRARSRSLRRKSRSRGRRSRSRSRGRYSPIRGGRRRYSRSRSRKRDRRSRSRSRNRRNRRTRSRTRSGSRSGRGSPSAALTSASRIEKPALPHSEFRPRVPEKDKDKEKKTNSDSKDKKEVKKPAKTSTTAATTAGKKLPFIGKMPVFKKQTTGQTESDISEANAAAAAATIATAAQAADASNVFMGQGCAPAAQRPPAPTAEQIKMAMMEDVYGNAPPFHPDAGVMHRSMDYEDLMPDPVQFVNLMSQAPPPAPPPPMEEENIDDDDDVLPPGIDENEMENEEFVTKPAPAVDDDAALPKDFEEALNIIFPGERKSEDENDDAGKEPSGETQIIVEQPVMQMDELYKDGIHLVSIEETSLMAIDEASQLSMNEPLVFNNAAANAINKNKATNEAEKLNVEIKLDLNQSIKSLENDKNMEDQEDTSTKSKTEQIEVGAAVDILTSNNENNDMEKSPGPPSPSNDDKNPMPLSSTETKENNFISTDLNLEDLADIPHPPAPLTESEKQRRQEELDDLALLGIDADDMAAQCM